MNAHETGLYKKVVAKIPNHERVKYQLQQETNQCWARAFLYLAEDKADVEENDANKYMDREYLKEFKEKILELEQAQL